MDRKCKQLQPAMEQLQQVVWKVNAEAAFVQAADKTWEHHLREVSHPFLYLLLAKQVGRRNWIHVNLSEITAALQEALE